MTPRVFLHPGPPKTGTTYLQSLLYANREAFLAQGISVLGSQGRHYRVANELMRRKSLRTTRVPEGEWDRMRHDVLRAPGDVVMSCERYSLFRDEHVQSLLTDLAGREVHALLTLRDLSAVLPARWQESIKNGDTATWAQFQQRIVEDPQRLRKLTRARSTLEVWAAALPVEKIHLVTVPPPGSPRTLLFERFCEALGADPARSATVAPGRANPSMDLVTTELIRRVNAQDAVKLSGRAQHSEIKSFLARELGARTRGVPELTPALLEVARGESRALVRRIETGGFHVIGDLGDLVSSTPSSSSGTGVDVSDEELLEAAAVAVAALAKRSWARARRLRQHESQPRPQRVRRMGARLRRRVRR